MRAFFATAGGGHLDGVCEDEVRKHHAPDAHFEWLQCVHKGLVRCRANDADSGDCLILVEAPVMADSAPCALTAGQRYMVFLQVGRAGGGEGRGRGGERTT